MKTSAIPVSLLGPDEPPAVEVCNAEGGGSAVLVCDHAANRVPQTLGSLGLSAAQLGDHIGWDPGAAEVARRLCAYLDAPLVLSGYSRLVIDCNRPLASPESIAERSGGVPVPGNFHVASGDRDRRVAALFQPYHGAIDRVLDARLGTPTVLLSIHSFTPVWHGQLRPWHVGVCHWRDRRLADLLRSELARSGDVVVGDNEPYAIDDVTDYTIPVHGEGRGLPSVMIEIRQDQLQTNTGAASWALRLAQAYGRVETQVLRLLAG